MHIWSHVGSSGVVCRQISHVQGKTFTCFPLIKIIWIVEWRGNGLNWFLSSNTVSVSELTLTNGIWIWATFIHNFDMMIGTDKSETAVLQHNSDWEILTLFHTSCPYRLRLFTLTQCNCQHYNQLQSHSAVRNSTCHTVSTYDSWQVLAKKKKNMNSI